MLKYENDKGCLNFLQIPSLISGSHFDQFVQKEPLMVRSKIVTVSCLMRTEIVNENNPKCPLNRQLGC